MDIASTPKILAAVALGATLTTALPKLSARDTVNIRFEWVEASAKKSSESLVLRAVLDEPTVIRQGPRTIEVFPTASTDGRYSVRLQLRNDSPPEAEALTTNVRAESGETQVILGRTRKDGKSVHENLLFLTVSPV